MKRVMASLAVVFLFLALAVKPAVAANTVTFNPLNYNVSLGDVFLMNLVGKEFSLPLDGGGLNINFNPAVLQINEITVDPIWSLYPETGTINNATGNVDGIMFAAWSSPSGNFNIATIKATIVGLGFSDLLLSENDINPFASSGNLVPLTYENGSVHVNGSENLVPEPATISLLLFGAGSLAGFSFKKKKI